MHGLMSRRHLINLISGCCSWVFDSRRLPKDQNQLVSDGDEKMEKLLTQYGKDHIDNYKGQALHQSADLVTNKVLAECDSFKEIMFERSHLFQSSVD